MNARSSDPVDAGEVVIGHRGPKALPGLVALVLGIAAVATPWLVGNLNFLVEVLAGVGGLALIMLGLGLLLRSVMLGALGSRVAPAARLGPVGIDYRVVSDTEYDLHVGWDEVTGCQMRISKLSNPMLCFDLRDPERIIAGTTGAMREALAATLRDQGTPIAVNFKRFNAPLAAISRTVRAGTSGRVYLRP